MDRRLDLIDGVASLHVQSDGLLVELLVIIFQMNSSASDMAVSKWRESFAAASAA